jgi:hypothetical protein
VKRIAFLILVSILFLVPSCSSGSWANTSLPPTETTTADSSEEITSAAQQTPTPEIQIKQPQILTGGQSGTVVLGIIQNDSDQHIAKISLEVSLLDFNGDLLDHQSISPLLEHLAPGEESPYAARFDTSEGIDSIEMEIIHSEFASFDRASLKFQETSTFTTRAGEFALLGTVTNSSNEPLNLHSFGILLTDESGSIIDLSTLAAGPTSLEPGQSYPVLLTLISPIDAGEWVFYADATTTTSLPPVELIFTREPSLELTDQGLPFVLGEIHNDAGYIRWVRLLIAAYHESDLLSCTVTTFPIPIHPDENTAFLETRLPGLLANAESQGISLEDIEIEVNIELNFARSFDETPIPLSVEIDRYQPVGSALILHGKITNTEEKTLAQPTVLATMRTTTGELVSTGWSIVSDMLAPAETLVFVLPLTLPQNTDTIMSEFDLYAVGFYP